MLIFVWKILGYIYDVEKSCPRNPMLGPIIFITKFVYRIMNIIGPSIDYRDRTLVPDCTGDMNLVPDCTYKSCESQIGSPSPMTLDSFYGERKNSAGISELRSYSFEQYRNDYFAKLSL